MEKILIVEDDAAIAASLARFLTSEGFAVQTAPGQTEALAALEESEFDLGFWMSVCATATAFPCAQRSSSARKAR